jgi:hypothetical protein
VTPDELGRGLSRLVAEQHRYARNPVVGARPHPADWGSLTLTGYDH